MYTAPVHGNCFFAAFYLLLRGKADRIVAVNSESPRWPHHYLIVNKNGHVLHFQHIHPHAANHYAPWWFEGHFIGIRKSKQHELLRKMNRKVLWSVNQHMGLLVLLTIYMTLFFPWLLGWLLYTPKWTFMGTMDALRRRFFKRRIYKCNHP